MSKELHKLLEEKFAVYSILPKAEQRGFMIGYNLRVEEIERLKGENEKLASVISDVIRKHSIKDDIDFNY